MAKNEPGLFPCLCRVKLRALELGKIGSVVVIDGKLRGISCGLFSHHFKQRGIFILQNHRNVNEGMARRASPTDWLVSTLYCSSESIR